MTIGFGALLAILGVVGFVATGSIHYTSLIPCWFGLALVVCGALASTPDAKRRMLWMHIAVTIALLGWAFPGFMAIKAFMQARGNGSGLLRPAATYEQVLMAVVCMVFFVLCVRSFVAARRERLA